MPPRSKPFVRAALVLVVCGAIGCGLSVTGEGISPGEDDAGVDASPTSTSPRDGAPPPPDGAPGLDAPAAADAPLDVTAIDAPPAEGGGPCDQDGDGYLTTGGTCNGDDCCDVDALVHPGQTSFFTSASHCGSFDYDCNGREIQEWGGVNCQLGFFTCSGDGFNAPQPDCGQTGTYATCNLGVFSCNTSTSSRVQACN